MTSAGSPILIHSNEGDPSYHLAAEEVLLNQTGQDYILLYINRPSVIIGKHQNPYREANLCYCNANEIGIYRRLSGGGTVFHDEGNVNFCFIRNVAKSDDLIQFGRFLRPVQEFLATLGVDAVFSGRNDLLVSEFKVSGNAEHVLQKCKRVIHHGTLLYNSSIAALGEAIRPNSRVSIESHAVHSVRSPVANIKELGKLEPDTGHFCKMLANYLRDHHGADQADLEEHATAIHELQKRKYNNPDWNFGYSPHYIMHTDLDGGGTLSVEVRKMEIIHASFRFEGGRSIPLPGLIGQKHSTEVVDTYFREQSLQGIILPADPCAWF